MRLAFALVAVLAAVVGFAVPTSAEDPEEPLFPLAAPLFVDLDDDPEDEVVRIRETGCFVAGELVAPPCPDDEFPARRIRIEIGDFCEGELRTHDVLRRDEGYPILAEVVELDRRTRRPELIIGAADGASGRAGQIVVGRLTDVEGEPCPRFRRLLSLGPHTPSTRKPSRASYHATGGVRDANLRKQYGGQELIVEQPWYTRRDAGCCPTYISRADFRYDREEDRYVRYRSRIRRLGEDRPARTMGPRP